MIPSKEKQKKKKKWGKKSEISCEEGKRKKEASAKWPFCA